MVTIRIPTRQAEFKLLYFRIKLAVTQPYWVRRLRSDRFDREHRLYTAQPPRKLWEIIVPWHARGDMRKRLVKPVTFWGSLFEASGRVWRRMRP